MFTAKGDKGKAREKIDVPSDALVVTFVGRIQPHKGPEVLIRAIAEMVTHSPHLRSKLLTLIVGGASGANGAEVDRLKELVQWLGISDVVRFAPPVDRAGLADYYRASDLVCVRSTSMRNPRCRQCCRRTSHRSSRWNLRRTRRWP